MRMKSSEKNTEVPQPQEKSRSAGSDSARKLVGMAAACALVGGCSSSQPAIRYGPPPFQPCPPGAAEAMRNELGIVNAPREGVIMPGGNDDMTDEDPVVVTEGRNEVVTYHRNWLRVPRGSVLVGEFIFGDMLYGRFTEIRLPDGRRLPFCGTLMYRGSAHPGVPWMRDSKPGAMKVGGTQLVRPEWWEH
jgi:hypothetical protein